MGGVVNQGKTWRLFLLLGSAIVIGITSFLVLKVFSEKTSNQVHYVDASGRQRMLSQRMAFLSEQLMYGNESVKEELAKVVDTHNKTLNVLLDGGEVPGFGYELTKTEDKEIRELIVNQIKPFWSEYYASFQVLIKGREDLKEDALKYIEVSAKEMLKLNNDLVQAYSKHSLSSQDQMNNIILLILFSNLVVIILIFRISRTYNQQKEELIEINNNLLVAEEELRANQEELNAILDDVSKKNYQLEKDKIVLNIIQDVSEVGYWELDIDDLIISHSGIVQELYGISRDTKLGFVQSLSYYPNEYSEQVREAYRNAIESKSDFELLVPFLKEKKEKIWVKVIGRVRLDDTGKVISIYGTLQDMSKQKEKEALEIMYNELEKTASFKSDFLAQMSHEIRTPLNGIVGAIENILGGSIAEATKDELLTVIKDSSFDLLHIVDNVLKLSKLEAGQEKVELVDSNPEKVLKSTFRLYETKAKAEGSDINVLHDESLPDVISIDEPRVKQVLNNLVSNAIKYTRQGKVQISSHRETVLNENYIRFTVSDTGEGMTQREMDKIFFKYEQGDDFKYRKLTGEIRGTGLGLAISKQLVELMGGNGIQVESEKGKGSTFSFAIPYSIVSIKDESEQKTEVSEDKEIEEGLNVLLVEDIKANQLVASLLLKSFKCNVDVANNGEEAIMKYMENTNKYDLILMDIQMPIMDGIVATSELKRLYPDTICPIIALSANAMEGDREKYLSKGLDDYMPKPIRKDVLQKYLVGIKKRDRS